MESFSQLQNITLDPKQAKDGGRFSIHLKGLWIRPQKRLRTVEGFFLLMGVLRIKPFLA